LFAHGLVCSHTAFVQAVMELLAAPRRFKQSQLEILSERRPWLSLTRSEGRGAVGNGFNCSGQFELRDANYFCSDRSTAGSEAARRDRRFCYHLPDSISLD